MTASRPLTRRWPALGGLALVGALALTGCSAGAMNASPSAVSPVTELSARDGATMVDPVSTDRSIITTGWATVLVEEPVAAAGEATRIAERAGGHVESSSTNAPSEYSGGSASVTLRVPAASLAQVLEEIGALGELQSSSTNSVDVTMQVADLDARIGALESAIERLTELLAEADSTDALIQIETAMTDRQAELDSLRAQQRQLDDQVSMSTLTVDFQTEPTAPKTGPGDFLAGIVAGWDALVAFGGGLLVVAGVLLPWLVPIAIIVLVVWLIVRAVRRRRPAAPGTLPASAAPTPEAPGTTPPADQASPAAAPGTTPTTPSGWPIVPPREDA